MKQYDRKYPMHYHFTVSEDMKREMREIADIDAINWQKIFRAFVQNKINDCKRERQT